jgi:hypothetical protein
MLNVGPTWAVAVKLPPEVALAPLIVIVALLGLNV